MDVAGKTVWITGASSGIGAALATACARAGAKLVLSGRRADALAEVAGRCQAQTLVLPFETTDLDAVQKALAGKCPEMTEQQDLLQEMLGEQ